MDIKLKKWSTKQKQVSPLKRRASGEPDRRLVIVTTLNYWTKSRTDVRIVRLSVHPRIGKQMGWGGTPDRERFSMDYDNGDVVIFPSEDGAKVGLPTRKGASPRYIISFPLGTEYAKLFDDMLAVEVEASDGKLAFTLKPA